MTVAAPAASRCANCGTPEGEEEKLDPGGWCAACRTRAIERADTIAKIVSVVLAIPVAMGMAQVGAFSHRFTVLWVALAFAFLFLLFKVARRVAFEVVRSRGVPTA